MSFSGCHGSLVVVSAGRLTRDLTSGSISAGIFTYRVRATLC
jgi:hypothetical protein